MNWNKIKIGSFLKERTGRYKPAEANKMGLKRVEKIDFSGTYHLVEKATNTDMILVKKGDLLISGINAEKGAVTVYDEAEDALATIHYSSYEFDRKEIDVDFFRWFLISDAFKNLLKKNAGSGIKTELKAKHLLPLEIYLPELDEQRQIVLDVKKKHKKVSDVQSLVEEQEAYLQQLRRAILLEAVQGKLTKQDKNDEPADKLLQRIKAEKQKLIAAGKLKKEKELPPITEDELPFELPKGWVWCRFGQVAIIRSNLVDPKKFLTAYQIAPDTIEKGTGKLLGKKTVQEAEIKSWNHYFFSNQIIYSKIRPNLSKAVIVDFEGLCSADMYPIESLINNKYLLNFILSVPFLNQVVKTDNRIKMPKINQVELNDVLVSLPPLSEQQRIVAKVEKLMQMVNELEKPVQLSQTQAGQLLQAVLKEAFNPPASGITRSGKSKEYKMSGGETLAAG